MVPHVLVAKVSGRPRDDVAQFEARPTSGKRRDQRSRPVQSCRHVEANDYRVPGEKLAFYVCAGLFGVVVFLLTDITLGAWLLLLVPSVIWLKVRQGSLLVTAVRISEAQFPEVYACAATAAHRLSMRMPSVFIAQDPTLNASAMGFLGKKSVVLHSALVEALEDDELTAVLGHEFSHVKCGHTNWLVIADSLPVFSRLFHVIFLSWSRKCEFTCDRGGALACCDPQVMVRALAKMAVGRALFEKMNLDALWEQAQELDEDALSRVAEFLQDHPAIVRRARALARFAESSTYASLVSR